MAHVAGPGGAPPVEGLRLATVTCGLIRYLITWVEYQELGSIKRPVSVDENGGHGPPYNTSDSRRESVGVTSVFRQRLHIRP